MSTYKTNEQLLRALLKDLNTFEAAILRERLLTVSVMTRQAVSENDESFNSPFTNKYTFIDLCDKIDKHLKVI